MTETAAGQALAQARNEINKARVAAAGGDTRRQGEYARAAIDYATTSLVDPAATQREVVAAHYFLSEALALDARGNTCGVELIDIEREASGLADEDQLWLRKVLRTAGNNINDARHRRGMESGSGLCARRARSLR
jgi:hypothetical protein